MGAVAVVVTRGGCVEPARVRAVAVDVAVDRVVPVVVVVGCRAGPAAVVRLEGVVRPAHAGVLVADHDPLAGEAHRPELGSVHLDDARLDGRGRLGLGDAGLRDLAALDPLRAVVRFDRGDVRPGREVVNQRRAPAREDHVCDPVRLVGDAPRAQHGADGRLRAGGFRLERPVDVPAASILVRHPVGRAQIGLSLQVDDDRGLIPVRRVPQDFGFDLRLIAAGRGPAVSHDPQHLSAAQSAGLRDGGQRPV